MNEKGLGVRGEGSGVGSLHVIKLRGKSPLEGGAGGCFRCGGLSVTVRSLPGKTSTLPPFKGGFRCYRS